MPYTNDRKDSKKRMMRQNQKTKYIVNFLETSQSHCVGMVDIIDSTKIIASLNQQKLSKVYEIFLNSMAQIVERFDGYVIKNVGDSLLFYFPQSPSTKPNDSWLECCIKMIEEHPSIKKSLVKQKLPILNYRVSADYGPVSIMQTGHNSSIDVFGTSVIMCTKINRLAQKNGFVIGSDMYRLVCKNPNYKFKLLNSRSEVIKFMYPVYQVFRK